MSKQVSYTSMIILKDHQGSLSRVEQFLRARDWNVQTVLDVRVVVNHMMSMDVIPKFVLLSLDHPQQQVQYLPALIAKQFGATVVAYFETKSPNQAQRAEALGIRYVLFAPISGPAVERMVNRIKLDEDRAAEQRESKKKEKRRRGKVADEGDQVIQVVGKITAPVGSNVTVEKGVRSAKANLITQEGPKDKKKGELIFTERNLGKEFSQVQKGAPSLGLDDYFPTGDAPSEQTAASAPDADPSGTFPTPAHAPDDGALEALDYVGEVRADGEGEGASAVSPEGASGVWPDGSSNGSVEATSQKKARQYEQPKEQQGESLKAKKRSSKEAASGTKENFDDETVARLFAEESEGLAGSTAAADSLGSSLSELDGDGGADGDVESGETVDMSEAFDAFFDSFDATDSSRGYVPTAAEKSLRGKTSGESSPAPKKTDEALDFFSEISPESGASSEAAPGGGDSQAASVPMSAEEKAAAREKALAKLRNKIGLPESVEPEQPLDQLAPQAARPVSASEVASAEQATKTEHAPSVESSQEQSAASTQEASRRSALAKLRQSMGLPAQIDPEVTPAAASQETQAASQAASQADGANQPARPSQVREHGPLHSGAHGKKRSGHRGQSDPDNEGPHDVLPDRIKDNLSASHLRARERLLGAKANPGSVKENAPVDPLDVFSLDTNQQANEVLTPVEQQVPAGPKSVPPQAPAAPELLAPISSKPKTPAAPAGSIEAVLTEAMSLAVDEMQKPGGPALLALGAGKLVVSEVAAMDLVYGGRTSSLIGCAGNQSIEFMEELRKHVSTLFAGKQFELSVTQPKVYRVPSFDFRRWAEEQCRNLNLGVKNHAPVGLASLEIGRAPDFVLQPSSRDGLWRLNLDEIWADVVLDFDVHLHFPLNNRFMHYLKKGDLLDASRKSRLKARGVNEVHIQFTKVEDLEAFFKHYQLVKSLSDYTVAA